jgi:hypothetical protein
MDATGRATRTWGLHGLWADCLFEPNQFVDGLPVPSWADPVEGCRAGVGTRPSTGGGGADTNGRAFIFHGRIEGDRLVMETLGESPANLLFTWDVVDELTATWKDEVSFGAGPGS